MNIIQIKDKKMKTIMAIIFVVVVAPSVAQADTITPYLEVGLGYRLNYIESCEQARKDRDVPYCVNVIGKENPLGIIELGVQIGPWGLGATHISSIPNQYDSGVDLLFVKFRFE